jgi:hypothetical protein
MTLARALQHTSNQQRPGLERVSTRSVGVLKQFRAPEYSGVLVQGSTRKRVGDHTLQEIVCSRLLSTLENCIAVKVVQFK